MECIMRREKKLKSKSAWTRLDSTRLTYEQNVDDYADTPHIHHLVVRMILQNFRRDVCWRTTPTGIFTMEVEILMGVSRINLERKYISASEFSSIYEYSPRHERVGNMYSLCEAKISDLNVGVILLANQK